MTSGVLDLFFFGGGRYLEVFLCHERPDGATIFSRIIIAYYSLDFIPSSRVP